MNRQYRTVIVMTIAVLTAALASFGVYMAIQRMPVKQVEVGTVKVVVAAEPLFHPALHDALDVSRALDDGRQPVDREVFTRELDYYQIREASQTERGPGAN